jgi:hypothetical protein
LIKELSYTGARSSIILKAYTSDTFIKTDDSNTTIWSTMGGKFTTTKTGICLWHFTPRVQSQEINFFFFGISCRWCVSIIKKISYDYCQWNEVSLENQDVLVTFSLAEFNLKKQICSSWAFNLDDYSEASTTYDMVIENQARYSWRVRQNHQLYHQKRTWLRIIWAKMNYFIKLVSWMIQ